MSVVSVASVASVRAPWFVLAGILIVSLAGLGCDQPNDRPNRKTSAADAQREAVELAGPFPQSVEGDFKISEVSADGSGDYQAIGWIKTGEGDVSVHGFGDVLEDGDAEDGGYVTAKLVPSQIRDKAYRIIAIEITEKTASVDGRRKVP